MSNHWTIEGLRGVGQVKLKFDAAHRVRVLFGTNGVGKTKCLEAIFEATLLSNKMFSEHVARRAVSGGWELMNSVTTEDGNIFKSSGRNGTLFMGMPPENRRLHEYPVVFLSAANRTFRTPEQKKSDLVGTFEDRREKYFSRLFSAVANSDITEVDANDDVQAWFVSRAQSVNPFQKTSDNRRVEIDAVMEMLSVVDSRIDSSSLQIGGNGRVSISIDGAPKEFRHLSSGFASLVKLMQEIVAGYSAFTNEVNLRTVPGIVFIDEIESHLHAQWQARIIPALKEMLPNTTFYIATHSPLVLVRLDEGEAYLLSRDTEGVARSEEIDSPGRRAFADVIDSTFAIDLNKIKRDSLLNDDQSKAKAAMLDLLRNSGAFK